MRKKEIRVVASSGKLNMSEVDIAYIKAKLNEYTITFGKNVNNSTNEYNCPSLKERKDDLEEAFKDKNVDVIIATSTNCKITKLDINKFNKQYPMLKIVSTNKFHDRFIVIDDKELYHCGASLKDLGKKCFAISKMLDTNYIEEIKKVC